MTSDDAGDATASSLQTLLRRYAAFAPPEDELQYTVELVLAAAEAGGDDRAAVALAVREALADVGFLDDTQLPAVADAVATLLVSSPDKKEDEQGGERRQQWHAVLAHYAIGERCLAVLVEDGEWHPARVRRHLVAVNGKHEPLGVDALGQTVVTDAESLVLEVEFFEFGKTQRLALADVVMDEDVAGSRDDDVVDDIKVCAMCERPMNLTAHHVTPRVTHAKYLKLGYSREFLNTCIMICRQCHSKVHAVEDEKTLARDYNSLDKIVAHPEIARWIAFAKKQKARVKPERKTKWRVGT